MESITQSLPQTRLPVLVSAISSCWLPHPCLCCFVSFRPPRPSSVYWLHGIHDSNYQPVRLTIRVAPFTIKAEWKNLPATPLHKGYEPKLNGSSLRLAAWRGREREYLDESYLYLLFISLLFIMSFSFHFPLSCWISSVITLRLIFLIFFALFISLSYCYLQHHELRGGGNGNPGRCE